MPGAAPVLVRSVYYRAICGEGIRSDTTHSMKLNPRFSDALIMELPSVPCGHDP